MRAWRIYPHDAAYARAPNFDPLDGAGGLVAAGRWNHPGQPIVYATSNPSLAVLETVVRVTSSNRFGTRTLLEIELADDTDEVTADRFEQLLREAPSDDPQRFTRDYGTAWLRERRSLALLVPSAVVPQDRNVLINPLHVGATSLKALGSHLVRLDSRLLRLERH